jgi:hypothetical protein
MVNKSLTASALEKLATRIRAEHAAVAGDLASATLHAKNAGAMLREAKKQVKHGEWMTWLAIHCDISDRSARAYMRVAKHWRTIEANGQSLADLSVSKALALIAPAPPKVVEFIPPSEDNTREDFEAVAARGHALLEARDAFTIDALPADEQDTIAQGQEVLAQQAQKPGGIAWLRARAGAAVDVITSLRQPPTAPRDAEEPGADAEAEALEAFATAIIEAHEDAGESPEDVRDSLFDVAELLLLCEHPVRWSGYLRSRGKELVAEAAAETRTMKLSGGGK